MNEVMMPTFLYVEASPRKAMSASAAAAGAFLSALRMSRPDVVVERLDLWDVGLPEFDGALIAAKYARLADRVMNAAEAKAWDRIGDLVAGLSRADAVVIATPMWNFGIPYKLKQWIDLITQPGLSFSFDPDTGYTPLLRPRPTLVILSSAGDYATGISRGRPDLATPYLKAALGFVGLDDITVEAVPAISGSPEVVAQARERVHERLVRLAGRFLEQVA